MKPRNTSVLSLSARPSSWLGLCTLTFSLLTAGSAMAQTSTWDGGGGTGAWNLDTNWALDTLPVPATATTYNLGGNVQNTLNNNLTGVLATSLAFTNNGLTSNTNAFTLGGNPITLNTQNNAVVTTAIGSVGANITDTISAALIGTGIRTFNIGLGHDLNLTGGLSGTSGSLSKGGRGTLTLSGTGSTYTGLTYVDSGTLKLGANDMLPGTTLEIKRGSATDSSPIFDLSGFSDTIGAINLGHNPATSLTNHVGSTGSIIDSVGGGLLTLGGNITYRSGLGTGSVGLNGQYTISANIATGNAARNFTIGDGSATEDLVISGAISGSGTITKQGLGTLVFSGANSYSGQVNIEQGTLKLGANNTLPDAVANVVQLGINGSTTGVVLDINGRTDTVGPLRLNGASGGTLSTAGLTHSIIDSAGGGILTLGNTFNVFASIGANQYGQATISANLNTGNAIRNLNVEDSTGTPIDLLVSGTISGAGNGFNKIGAGTVALSNVNTYSGDTRTGEGVILVQNNLALQNSALDAASGTTGTVTLGTGITTPTFGGLKGTRNLISVITSGYSSMTNLTLKPDSGSVSYSGVLANGATDMLLTKTGAGTQILSGANSYSGNTNVNGGNLVIAGTQTGNGQLIVNNAAILTFGDGSSTNGSSTNSGPIFVNNTGTVQINKADGATVTNAVASNPSATTTLAGGNASGTTNTFTATSYNNGGGFAVNSVNAGATLAFSGATGAIDLKGTNLTVSGAGNTLLTSAGQGFYSSTSSSKVIKQGTGTLIFQGNQGFTGNMEIDAGTVRVDLAQTNSGTYFVGNGATTGTAASLLVGGGSAGLTGGVTFNRAITINPGNGTNRTVGGTNTAGTNVISSALNMSGSFGEDRSVTLTAAAGGTVDISGAVTGAGQNIIKSGSGTVILSNASGNTYTGNTSVNAGKLIVTGAVTGSAFSVSNAGTVLASDAAASIGSGLTINNGSILAPGDAAAAGTITVGASGTTFNDNSIFSWDINAAGTSYDKLVTASVAGEVAAGDAVFRIVVADSTFANSFWTNNQTWSDIFTTNGSTAIASWSAVFGNAVSVVNSGFTTLDTSTYGSFTISGSSLTWSAVPEPSSALAGLLIAAGLLRRRRA